MLISEFENASCLIRGIIVIPTRSIMQKDNEDLSQQSINPGSVSKQMLLGLEHAGVVVDRSFGGMEN